MEITKKEILFSTAIFAVLIGIGVWISNPIISNAIKDATVVNAAVKIDNDPEQFAYIARTNVGDFIAEGTLKTVDPVSIPDIEGKYMRIEKVREEYRSHTRVVTTTDGKGHTHTHTETYWTWDAVGREWFEAKTLSFLDVLFPVDSINYNNSVRYNTTIDAPREFLHNKTRYVYYTHPTEEYGIMRGIADNKSFSKLFFKGGKTIEQCVESANSSIKSAPVCFWILWILLSGGLVFGFYALENRWLNNDNNSKGNKEIYF